MSHVQSRWKIAGTCTPVTARELNFILMCQFFRVRRTISILLDSLIVCCVKSTGCYLFFEEENVSGV